MSALETHFREQVLKAVETSVSHTSALEEQVYEFAQLRSEFFLPSEAPRTPSRTFLNELIRLHPINLGMSTPEPGDIFSATFVREDACFRSLLVDTVPLRLFRNEEWDILLPHLSDARPYVFRQLSVADTACVALLMNHNFAGKAEGATCSLTPLLRRVAKKAGVRVTDPRNASPPKDWSVTFDSRAFPPRRERLPPFVDSATNGKAIGAVLRATHVTFYGCHHINQLPMRSAIEMTFAFYLPSSDNVSFADVWFRPTAESVSETIAVNDEVN